MTISPDDLNHLVAQVNEERLVASLASMIAIPSVNPFDEPVDDRHREEELHGAFLNNHQLERFLTSVEQALPGLER